MTEIEKGGSPREEDEQRIDNLHLRVTTGISPANIHITQKHFIMISEDYH